jgi:hypothetical protein
LTQGFKPGGNFCGDDDGNTNDDKKYAAVCQIMIATRQTIKQPVFIEPPFNRHNAKTGQHQQAEKPDDAPDKAQQRIAYYEFWSDQADSTFESSVCVAQTLGLVLVISARPAVQK